MPPEVAEARIAAALEAGGALVSDERAPEFWVLADAQGNKACITTGRDAAERGHVDGETGVPDAGTAGTLA